jgi:hypothetical protein
MTIDVKGWPIVQMCFRGVITQPQFEHWLATLTDCIARNEPFAVITLSEEPLTLPDGYRQLEAVWYKQYKQPFASACKGLARIASNDAQFAKLNTPAMHKAWGCPYFVCRDLASAERWAAEQL